MTAFFVLMTKSGIIGGMNYAQVYVEHEAQTLNHPWTYACTADVLPGSRVEVPFGKQVIQGVVFEVSNQKPEGDFEIREIIRVLDEKPLLNQELRSLAASLAYDCIVPVMTMVKTMLPGVVRPGSEAKPVSEDWLQASLDFDRQAVNEKGKPVLTPRQLDVLQALENPMRAADARKQLSAGVIRTLLEKGALIKTSRLKTFALLDPLPQKPWPELNVFQKNALVILRQNRHRPVLLFGVTGSGKTEVFFHLAKDALEQKKQVLVLVPEISLTPMMLKRFGERFDCPVFACHSRLSSAQHLDVFHSIAKAGPCIVIGTRKSVFLPFNNLGLIIMDEEHDGSYKQDSTPRYHARDAALCRAKLSGCPLVLASATPSLETYAKALKGVYGLAELPKRAGGQDARVHVVNLLEERSYTNLSVSLLKALQERLKKKEKSLLLLNRRGYLPTVRCTQCKEYLVCEDCRLPLSYHRGENALVCHVCGKRYAVVQECPNCHSHELSTIGQGTERLEEDIQNLFQDAHLVRMDRDSTRTKNAHANLLEEFESEGDILLGTQMISKGLDFEQVTLAGILSVDGMLSRPDYCSAEQAYQLIEQTAGRAGRGRLAGDVYIQTFNPQHYVIESVRRHDYRAFFAREMQYRHIGGYPPYTYMASIVFSHENPSAAHGMAAQVQRKLQSSMITALGPMEISMRQKKTRFRLVIKEKSDEKLKAVLWKFRDWFEKNKKGCTAEINVHPMMLEG